MKRWRGPIFLTIAIRNRIVFVLVPEPASFRHPVWDAFAKANESQPNVKPSEEAVAVQPDPFAPPAKNEIRINDEATAFDFAGWCDRNGKLKLRISRGSL